MELHGRARFIGVAGGLGHAMGADQLTVELPAGGDGATPSLISNRTVAAKGISQPVVMASRKGMQRWTVSPLLVAVRFARSTPGAYAARLAAQSSPGSVPRLRQGPLAGTGTR